MVVGKAPTGPYEEILDAARQFEEYIVGDIEVRQVSEEARRVLVAVPKLDDLALDQALNQRGKVLVQPGLEHGFKQLHDHLFQGPGGDPYRGPRVHFIFLAGSFR